MSHSVKVRIYSYVTHRLTSSWQNPYMSATQLIALTQGLQLRMLWKELWSQVPCIQYTSDIKLQLHIVILIVVLGLNWPICSNPD